MSAPEPDDSDLTIGELLPIIKEAPVVIDGFFIEYVGTFDLATGSWEVSA